MELTRDESLCYTQSGSGGDTHYKKRRSERHHKNLKLHIVAKGESPIEKNIVVVDEQGNEYEATYLKRAKGLVKHGRARFLSENRICLACPPNRDLEEHKMNEYMDTKQENGFDSVESTELIHADTESNITAKSEALTMDYVLLKIEEIHRASLETSKLGQTVDAILNMPLSDSPNGGLGDSDRAQAIKAVFQSREETYHQLLGLYERMYDDLKPKQPAANISFRDTEVLNLKKEIVHAVLEKRAKFEDVEDMLGML